MKPNRTKRVDREKYRELLQDKHYYLDQILPKDWNYYDADFIDGREKRWINERKKYGFDERETWCMENEFYIWLYEHIMRYKEICCVDLNFHKFNYEDKEYTQLELMDNILERIEFWFTSEYEYKENLKIPKKLANNKYFVKYSYYDSWNEEHFKITHEIAKIWAIILPAMWW